MLNSSKQPHFGITGLRAEHMALSLQIGGCYECYGYDSCDGKPQRE